MVLLPPRIPLLWRPRRALRLAVGKGPVEEREHPRAQGCGSKWLDERQGVGVVVRT